MVGGITFPAASLVAVFRPEVAKTVSCSTVASMGLIVACGGIGSAEAVAAGILLLLLHGVSKALMLASAGTAALDHEKIRWKTGSFNTGIVYRKTKAVSMHADRNRNIIHGEL